MRSVSLGAELYKHEGSAIGGSAICAPNNCPPAARGRGIVVPTDFRIRFSLGAGLWLEFHGSKSPKLTPKPER